MTPIVRNYEIFNATNLNTGPLDHQKYSYRRIAFIFLISGEFSRAFREWPTYPLNSLLLGISYLHLSCQKFHETRHTSILHVSYFSY